MTLYDEIYQWLGNECGCGGDCKDCIQNEDDGIYCCESDEVCIYPLMHRVYLIDRLMQNFVGYEIAYDELYTNGLKLIVDSWNMKYDLVGSEGKVDMDVLDTAKFYRMG